jgi:hypothetical protein
VVGLCQKNEKNYIAKKTAIRADRDRPEMSPIPNKRTCDGSVEISKNGNGPGIAKMPKIPFWFDRKSLTSGFWTPSKLRGT